VAQLRYEGRPTRLQGSSTLGRVVLVIGPSGHQDDSVSFLLDATTLKPVLESDAGWGRLDVARGWVVLHHIVDQVVDPDAPDRRPLWRAEVRNARTGKRLRKHEPAEDLHGYTDEFIRASWADRIVRFEGGEARVVAEGGKLVYQEVMTGKPLYTEAMPYSAGGAAVDLDAPMLTVDHRPEARALDAMSMRTLRQSSARLMSNRQRIPATVAAGREKKKFSQYVRGCQPCRRRW
jgi:hypothetical protein